MSGYQFGDIVILPFPFAEKQQSKTRPALVISVDKKHKNYVVAVITSSKIGGDTPIDPEIEKDSGLENLSFVNWKKLGTFNHQIINGKIGTATKAWLREAKNDFYASFGFDSL